MTNFSHCKVADAEIDRARVATDPRKQDELWKLAQQKIVKDVCAVPLMEVLYTWARRDTVDYGYDLRDTPSGGPPDHREHAHHHALTAVWRYLGQRMLFSVVTLFLVASLVFVIVRVIPGDPAQTMLGDQASRESLEALRDQLGLNRPIVAQYATFLVDVARGRWGVSMVSGRSVLGELMAVLPSTLELTLASLAIGAAVGMPLGVLAALRRNRLADYAIRIGSLAGISFPVFVSGLFLLLVFAIHVPLFPVINAGGETIGQTLHQLVLPSVNLGLIVAAYVTRVMRSALLEVGQEDYVRTARAKGVPERAVIWVHCLRNAMLPVVTFLGLYMGILTGSAVLTEIVFSRPGLGKLIVTALSQRDYTTLQGLVLAYAFILIAINTVTDLAYGVIDPRIRYGKA